MKILSGLMLFVLLGIAANGQQVTSSGGAKVIAEVAASAERVVKGAPFTAEAVSESVQTLADGNRIVRNSTSKLYRNSEGRFRRELSGGSGDVLGSVYSFGQGISIMDPVVGHRYLLDSRLKTARVTELISGTGRLAVTGRGVGASTAEKAIAAASEKAVTAAAQRAVVTEKHASGTRAGAPMVIAMHEYGAALAGTAAPSIAYAFSNSSAKYESRTEELGTQNIEGVNAEGKRTITTIPAGAIGNERPIEMVYESWYSNELQMVVMSKNSDPRFGEQTYRLTNIVRSEPDPSLFSLPTGYRILGQPGSVYRLSTTKFEAEKAAAAAKAAPAARP